MKDTVRQDEKGLKVVFPSLGKVINSIRVCIQAFIVALEFSTGVVSNYKPLNAKTNLLPILMTAI